MNMLYNNLVRIWTIAESKFEHQTNSWRHAITELLWSVNKDEVLWKEIGVDKTTKIYKQN